MNETRNVLGLPYQRLFNRIRNLLSIMWLLDDELRCVVARNNLRQAKEHLYCRLWMLLPMIST